MMDSNQCQKLFPQGMQVNSAFKSSKMNVEPHIDNSVLSQLGASNANGSAIQKVPNGMYGSMNTTLINSQNLGSGYNQNGNISQNGTVVNGTKTQQILGITSTNGNAYGNLASINQSANGFMNFSYSILDNGISGLGGGGGGTLVNGQTQANQIGGSMKSNENVLLNNEMGQKDLFQNTIKSILTPQQNQNMLIESTQNFLLNRNQPVGMGLDSVQLQQSCDQTVQNSKIYQEIMKNSGNQLESHNFSNQKQNQMQSSQNSLNGLNCFVNSQNNVIAGYDQQQQHQQQQTFLILQQQQQKQQQQQQIILPDSLQQQQNLIHLQQLRNLNNNNNNNIGNQNAHSSNHGKSLAKQILNDISDVDSESDGKQKELIEMTLNPTPSHDFLNQMRDFYNNDDQTQATFKRQKTEHQFAKKQEHLQIFISNMMNSFQSTLSNHMNTFQKYIEAISYVQASTTFVNNSPLENGNLQCNNENNDKNKANQGGKQVQNYENVIDAWDCINDCVQTNLQKIVQTLQLQLEDAIWNFNIAYHSQEINQRKLKLTFLAAKKIFDEKYDFNQADREIERFLDVLIKSKYEKSSSSSNIQDNQIKHIIDSSSDYAFNITEDPTNQSVHLGYSHKNSKVKQGRGIILTSDNSVFQGYLQNDMPSGQGRIIYPSCNIYEGHFEAGLQNGKGKYTWENGNVYEGGFEKGRRSGRGKFTWSDGRTYEGYCSNDVANGFGEYINCIYSSQKQNTRNPHCFEIYRGNWRNNKMDGKGILFVGLQAEWKDNHMLSIN